MIEYVKGSIFDAEVEALVNPVNCVGIMGAGLAKEFKDRFPEYFEDYKEACDHGYMKVGRVLIHPMWGYRPKFDIISFPTKHHWKNLSSLEIINAGLLSLVQCIKINYICSIAIPALGCGLGGLEWDEVKPLIDGAFSVDEMKGIKVLVYEPVSPSGRNA